MTYTIHPVKFEIYDETKELAATVEVFDEVCASVDINTLVDRTSFDRLVPLIQQVLSAMKLEAGK